MSNICDMRCLLKSSESTMTAKHVRAGCQVAPAPEQNRPDPEKAQLRRDHNVVHHRSNSVQYFLLLRALPLLHNTIWPGTNIVKLFLALLIVAKTPYIFIWALIPNSQMILPQWIRIEATSFRQWFKLLHKFINHTVSMDTDSQHHPAIYWEKSWSAIMTITQMSCRKECPHSIDFAQ